MEMSYSDLRSKEVINLIDGRRLGRVCDLVFCYPENRIIGIVVPGSKGFSLWKGEQFIDMRNISKIGDDVILVNCNLPPKPIGKKSARGCNSIGTCPPDNGGNGGHGGGNIGSSMGGNGGNMGGHTGGNMGYCPPPSMPPHGMEYPSPSPYPPPSRRSYEDYE